MKLIEKFLTKLRRNNFLSSFLCYSLHTIVCILFTILITTQSDLLWRHVFKKVSFKKLEETNNKFSTFFLIFFQEIYYLLIGIATDCYDCNEIFLQHILVLFFYELHIWHALLYEVNVWKNAWLKKGKKIVWFIMAINIHVCGFVQHFKIGKVSRSQLQNAHLPFSVKLMILFHLISYTAHDTCLII